MSANEPLAAELEHAEKTLKDSLDEACGTDVERVDTGELIKVEEMLSIASDAAKRAISIRRKQGQSQPEPAARPDGTAFGQAAAAEPPIPVQRRFADDDGTEWMVRAVHPMERTDARHTRLLGAFQQGWLAFECDQSKRRLSPIPADWEQLDESALRGLCAKADVAPRRDDRTQ
jgi:hypothetical protein